MPMQADDKVRAEIEGRYASHLYNKHDHDGAMTHFLATIGYLEPSFVIRKFLDAQRIHNLTSYLEALHDKVLPYLCVPFVPHSIFECASLTPGHHRFLDAEWTQGFHFQKADIKCF